MMKRTVRNTTVGLLLWCLCLGASGAELAPINPVETAKLAMIVKNTAEQITKLNNQITQRKEQFEEFQKVYSTVQIPVEFARVTKRTFDTATQVGSFISQGVSDLQSATYLSTSEKLAYMEQYKSLIKEARDVTERLSKFNSFKFDQNNKVPLMERIKYWDEALDQVQGIGRQARATTATWKLLQMDYHGEAMDSWRMEQILGGR